MIPVQKIPEPPHFAEKVLQKAHVFLSQNPYPILEEIRKKNYWTDALGDLHQMYNQICTYSALWCPLDAATVDHYRPIFDLVDKKEPQSAYDWNNFRLASRSMNSEKNKYQDVCDPFLVEKGWFVLDFPSMMIKCGSGIASDICEKVDATIKRLKLNEKEKYIEYRAGFLWDYCRLCRGYCPVGPAFKNLERKAPFIASELIRQKLTQKIVHMIKYPKKTLEECDE